MEIIWERRDEKVHRLLKSKINRESIVPICDVSPHCFKEKQLEDDLDEMRMMIDMFVSSFFSSSNDLLQLIALSTVTTFSIDTVSEVHD